MDKDICGVKPCLKHSGIEAKMDALCTKIDLRFGDVNRRVENLEKLVIRVGLLEQNKSFTSGSRHWSDYIITIGLSFLVFLLGHYILKY